MTVAELPEVARIARDLIRFDTSNWGEGRANPERPAADYVSALLSNLGLDVQTFEAEPGRTNVCARVEGRDRDRPALVLHGHLDVVPAVAADWSVDPFAGEVRDGMLWGRGAVDMKGMDAMIISSLSELHRAGEKPSRDVIVTFFADEEAGGERGSARVVAERPEWFAGATEAISEVGGYSVEVAGRRTYLLQVGEKALLWLRLSARGVAAHGSAVHADNAVTALAEAVVKIGRTPWPVQLTGTTAALLERFRQIAQTDETDPDALAALAGPAQRFIRASLRTTTNPTGLTAGYKHNVIPDHAEALIDVRTLPGTEDDVLAAIQDIVGDDIEITTVTRDIGLETPFAGDLVDAMVRVLGEHDPGAPVVPYLMGGGTDNKALSRLGIVGYGFAPLRLPADLDFTGMFHGVDERVPVESLVFGQRVLTDLLRSN
ncbi:M20/M25/M40 family metallo-hydrolase [Microbacterium gorillae]|uniref:M20/M25/M40 family metallo-hydrolase n=1 Tax=Microbacterium gorillae TaxID=1231063 RepID=UPI00058B6D6F|nr:M20/M25/M40 family metallo-hydrolase [Microbacterium gorillae]